MRFKIPLCKPEFSPRAKMLVWEVLNSGNLSHGRFSRAFEHEMSARHGCKFGVLSNSGTSALHVALVALKEKNGWENGAEVICPATTFVATANMILLAGLKPVFVDIEATTYGLDPNRIEDAITPKTRAIMAVHLFGIPCQVKRLKDLAEKYNFALIEDSCETVCASHKGLPVGSFGDVACFSFYACHQINCGIGGMSVTNNEELATLMRSLVNHGRDPSFINGMVSEAPPDQRFLFERLGFSYRVTEMEAALGLDQAENLWTNTKKRIAVGILLNASLKKEFGDLLHIPPMEESSYMMFPVVLGFGVDTTKTRFMEELEKAGIETREMLPLLSQPLYAKMGHDIREFPVSQEVKKRGFYFGIYPQMTEEDIQHIVSAFGKILRKQEATA